VIAMTLHAILRRTGAVGLGIVVVGGAPLLAAGSATAAAPGPNFAATAAADPVRVLTHIANFPATAAPIDSGGPSARVAAGSAGGGTAYSAAPDPGSFPSSLPGIGSGVLAQNGLKLPFQVPDYPLAVTADAQNPNRTVGAGGYELRADVGPSSASADTTTGGQSPGGNFGLMTADARIAPVEAGVQALAISDIQSLTVGPLTIAGVHSEASELEDQTGNVVKRSAFHVDAIRIGSLSIGLAPGGFTVAGTPVPADSQKSFNDMLAASGVSLEQFPATETPDGIVGAGLVVTQKFNAPQYGATSVSYRIGGVAVRLQGAGQPATTGSAGAGGVPSAPAGSVGQLAFPTGVTGLTGNQFPTGAAPLASGGPVSAPAAQSDAAGAVPGVAFAMPAAATRTLAAVDSNGIYLVVVAAGVIGLGVTRFVRASR